MRNAVVLAACVAIGAVLAGCGAAQTRERRVQEVVIQHCTG